MGPLAGIKVLDLGRALTGPWASGCLADFAADGGGRNRGCLTTRYLTQSRLDARLCIMAKTRA